MELSKHRYREEDGKHLTTIEAGGKRLDQVESATRAEAIALRDRAQAGGVKHSFSELNQKGAHEAPAKADDAKPAKAKAKAAGTRVGTRKKAG